MNLPSTIFVLRCLVRDTFRQSRANGIFWLMLAVSTMCILVCLSMSLSESIPFREAESVRLPGGDPESGKPDPGPDVIRGEVRFAFGAIRVPWRKYRQDAVHYVQYIMTGLVADTLGVLMALIWTAGFLPNFVQPGSASVLLAKPVPRWTLLAGKYLGVMVFVTCQVAFFIVGTWLALGVKTGVWDARYFVCLPMLLLHFGVFFSFSALLAVLTRSTVATIFGTLVFWLICWGMNYGHHVVVLTPELSEMSGPARFLVDVGYWILPKPADFGVMLLQSLDAMRDFTPAFDVETLKAKGAWHPELSIVTSILFAVVVVALAAYEWLTKDY